MLVAEEQTFYWVSPKIYSEGIGLPDSDEKKYPKTLLSLPSSKEILKWVNDLERKAPQKSVKIGSVWNGKFQEWQRGEWGNPRWSPDEASRRSAAYARGHYHYLIGQGKRREIGKKIEGEHPGDFKLYQSLDATGKRQFIEALKDRGEKTRFSSYLKASIVETRGLDLLKFAGTSGPPAESAAAGAKEAPARAGNAGGAEAGGGGQPSLFPDMPPEGAGRARTPEREPERERPAPGQTPLFPEHDGDAGDDGHGARGTRPQTVLSDRAGRRGIWGDVTDSKTSAGVQAVMHISGMDSYRGTTNETGRYFQPINEPGTDFKVECFPPPDYKRPDAKTVKVVKEWAKVDFALEKKEKKDFKDKSKKALGRSQAHFNKFLVPFAIFVLGALLSYVSGCMWLMLGFATWAALYIVPEPLSMTEFAKMKIQLSINLDQMGSKDGKKISFKDYFGNPNAGMGFFRSLLKISAICFFVAGIKFCTMPFQGILLPVVAFVGYFTMKTEVDPANPSTVIESTLRFSLLGCFVIPFWIFWSQFNSLSLAFIALAFFAVPPSSKKDTEGEQDMMSLFSKLLFGLLMLLALIGSGSVFPGVSFGASWELQGAMKVIFIYFWVVCGIAGFFSSAEARPPVGLFMLLLATVIYGMSAGTQDVGMALFGPYFPQAYKTITDITKPITEAFSQISGTFGTAWELLVNPMGFANRMMNSTYADDPLSKVKGPLGVEIDDLRTTPIYPYSPFSVIVKLRNRGASEAANLEVNISASEKLAPKEQKVIGTKDRLVLGDLGFRTDAEHGVTCYDDYGKVTQGQGSVVSCSQSVDGGKPLQRLDIRQMIFTTPFDENTPREEQGITCEAINKYALRESRFRKKWGIQFIPITASVAYDYKMGSTLDVSFISADEWSRLTEDEEAFVPMRKEGAKNTNSPAYLNVDTLEQPIREGTPFHLGLALISSNTKGSISQVYSIAMTLPPELAAHLQRHGCMPQTDAELEGKDPVELWKEGQSITLEWSDKAGKRAMPFSVIFCNFNGMDMGGKASSSFLVQANASFRYRTSDVEITSVEWGGGITCCTKDAHCPYTDIQVCDTAKQQCVLKSQDSQAPAALKLGDAGYCKRQKDDSPNDSNAWCKEGAGQCSADECAPGLSCASVDVSGTAMSLCCNAGKVDDCRQAYQLSAGLAAS